MWPLWLRPEPRFWLSVSAFTGGPLCRCGWTTFTIARRPADVGFTFCSGISALRREVDFLARLQADVGLFPRAAPAGEAPEALDLAADVRDLDALDLDLQQGLDGRLHFGLRRVRRNLEDHLVVLVAEVRAFFGHDRAQQDDHKALGIVVFGVHPRPPWANFVM